MKGNKPHSSLLTQIHKQIIQSYCDVCFGYFRKVPSKKINERLQILLCIKCKCKVHKCCYDLEANQTYISENVRQFICDKCLRQEKSNQKCFICHGENGAFKIAQGGEVIHVFCALNHSQIQILSYYPQIKFKKSDSYVENQKQCQICHKTNAFQKCAMQQCNKFVHPYCAKTKFIQQQQISDDPKCWNHHLGDGPNGMFDLSEQVIPFGLLRQQIYKEVAELQQQGVILNTNKQEVVQEVYQNYLLDIKKKKKNSKKLKRGGFSFVSCPLHQYTPHCLCNGLEQSENMIQCQCCLAWFHTTCIKDAPTSENQSFICSKCKSFYELKKKIIQEIFQGKSDNYEIKCDMPIKNNYMDYMWFLRVIDCRITKGFAAKMFRQLQKYPLRSSKMNFLLKIQCREKIQILCQNFYRKFFCEQVQMKNYKPLTVLRMNSQQKVQTIEQNVIQNRQIRKSIKRIKEFLKRQGIQDSFSELQKEFDFKEQAISDQYEKIIELSKSQQRYQQVEILKIKAQAYSFLQIVKKVNSGTTIITYNDLQQSLLKAKQIQNIPQYLIKPLKDKFQQVKHLIQFIIDVLSTNPNQQEKIQSSLNELQTLNISPPQIYFAYNEQRKLINKLYIYNLKQTGNKIEQELEILDKIDLLGKVQKISCNNELVSIINEFNQFKEKSNYKQIVFQGLKNILCFFQKQVIVFQLKDKINKKSCKAQKLKDLFNKMKFYHIQEPYLKQISENFWKIHKLMIQSIFCSLSLVDNIMDITSLRQKCIQVISLLQMYPIQIQCEPVNLKLFTWLKLSQNRKQELQQLLTLCTQSQLKKNPLSLQKIIPTISRENKLLRQYYHLKKQQAVLKKEFTQYLGKSSQRTQYFKRQGAKKLSRKQQLTENQQKPQINRINQFIQTLKGKKIDFKFEIQELKRLLNISLEISSKAKNYCKQVKQFQEYSNLNQLSQKRKQIQQLRRKILCSASFNLNDELIELYHAQIYNRMKSTVLTLSTSLDIQKIGKLLKFAEEQNLINCESYKKLKQKYDNKSQKTKQFTLIKTIQNQLNLEAAKDQDIGYKNLFAFRKTLTIPEVNLQHSKILYLEEMKQKNKQIKSKIQKILNKNQPKANFVEAKSLLLQGLKSPYSIVQISKLYNQVQKCNQLFRRWKDLNKNSSQKNIILNQYENLLFIIDDIQVAKKQFKQNQSLLQKIDSLYQKFDYLSKVQIQQAMSKLEQNIFGKDEDLIYQSKKKFLTFWHKYLSKIRQNKSEVVSYQKIKKILYDSYFCLQNDLRKGSFGGQYQFIIEHIQKIILRIKKAIQNNGYSQKNIVDNYIDIDELLYLLNSGTEIDDQLFVLAPYEDLSKFKFKNLNKVQTKSKQEILKRFRSDDMEFIKKSSQKQIQVKKQQSEQEEDQLSQKQQNQNIGIVTDKSRKKIKEILLKNIRKNQQLKKYGDCENEVKMIENQIFGQYHNDLFKYFQTSQKFQKLFMKLQQCPNISQKLIKKEFDFKFIKLLVENLQNITEFQNIMVNKIKQQQKQKKIHKIIEQVQQTKEPQKKNVLQMLATGKIDQASRKQIKKQIKMIKQNKHKKKKHKHKRSRSNSRSKSPEVQFSSQSEEQNNIPSYIKNEYSETLKQKTQKNYDFSQFIQSKEKEAPLMFDPDQQENVKQNQQEKYPKGSILKIKVVQIQMALKKKGKVQIKANLMTEQQYRKITMELVDPGCLKLNIRKQKNDKQIIEYLNKPNRKKYKYLVGWIQALNQEDNICLRDLSVQANQRHKVFGWQNQFIKIHIMSIKQFVQINKLCITPSHVSSQKNAKLFDTERMIYIVQYPIDKMFQLKQKYSPFKDIQKILQPHQVSIPLPSYDAMDLQNTFTYFQPPNINRQSITIKPLNYQDPVAKNVQFQGWGTDSQFNNGNSNLPKADMNNPYQIIRNNLGFGYFQLIQSDEQNNNAQQKNDLVQSLLKSVNQSHSSMPIGGSSSLPPYSQIRNSENYQVQNQIYNRYPSYQNNMQRYPSSTMQASNPVYQNWNNNQLPRYQPYNKVNAYNNNPNFNQNNNYQNPNIGRNPMMNNPNVRKNPMFGNFPGYMNQNIGQGGSINYNGNNQGNMRTDNPNQSQYKNRYNYK